MPMATTPKAIAAEANLGIRSTTTANTWGYLFVVHFYVVLSDMPHLPVSFCPNLWMLVSPQKYKPQPSTYGADPQPRTHRSLRDIHVSTTDRHANDSAKESKCFNKASRIAAEI